MITISYNVILAHRTMIVFGLCAMTNKRGMKSKIKKVSKICAFVFNTFMCIQGKFVKWMQRLLKYCFNIGVDASNNLNFCFFFFSSIFPLSKQIFHCFPLQMFETIREDLPNQNTEIICRIYKWLEPILKITFIQIDSTISHRSESRSNQIHSVAIVLFVLVSLSRIFLKAYIYFYYAFDVLLCNIEQKFNKNYRQCSRCN